MRNVPDIRPEWATRRPEVRELERLAAIWSAQDKRRLTILSIATLVAFAAVLFLGRMAAAPRMELLYAGLEPESAAEVVDALVARGAVHEVRGDSIWVDGAERDALRLAMAGEGLPRDGGAGYELLDGLSGFGTTSQMFDAAYWRAREGELTRTILAGTGVKMARVHLATADASPFARDRSATASVTLRMASGAVPPIFAEAVRSLVAGAVRDLSAEDVTVIDAASGRVVGGAAGDPEAEARNARTVEMRTAVEEILAARLGTGRFVVGLSLETTRDRETIRERRLDPDSRVVVSTEVEERNARDTGMAAGVTVASNLPDGDAAGGEGESSNAETRERVNYDFSATEREVERAPGAIERLTVAVMVDGLRDGEPGADGAWTPRPEAELEALRELVESAVGFREARGDVVTVRTMRFDLPPAAEPTPGLTLPWLSGGQITQLVAAALVALLGLAAVIFGVRPALRRLPDAQALPREAEAVALAAPEGDSSADQADAPREIGADGQGLRPDLALPGLPAGPEASLSQATLDLEGEAAPEDPVERLRQLISDRREETIEVLRGWMEEPELDRARGEPS